MGLFDSFFDPQQFQSGGGLIDRLLSQLGTQGQYQPSQGFGSNPMDANAGVAPQNAPIAVGNYLMPRIGGGFPQIDPQTGETVNPQQQPVAAPQMQPAAQPMAATPMQPAQQSGLPAPYHSEGGFGGAMRGAMANIGAGPLGLIGGAIAGGMGMGRGTDQDQQQYALNARYQALVPILGEQKARLAVIDPESHKVLIDQALGPDKFKVQQVGQDGLGAQQYKVFNPADGSFKDIPKNDGDTTNSSGGLGNTDLTGAAYLATVPKAQARIIEGITSGTLQPPSSYAMSKPYWQNMLSAAKNYDPSFDATQWGGRVAGVKDFSAGKSSEMVRSANQTVGHVGDLIDKMDALNNGQYPMKNAVGNYVNNNVLGNTGVTGFKQNAHAVADELSKVFKGVGISDHEIKQWEETLGENMSPPQQREAVTGAMSLLQHSLSALEEKRLNSIGPMAAEKAGPLLKPDAQAAVARIQKWAAGGSAAPSTSGAPAKTKTGVSWSIQ